MNKISHVFLLFILLSCSSSDNMEIDQKRIDGIKARNGFVSFEVWNPEFGTVSQPKYLAKRETGRTFVVKPQVPGAGPMEIAYFAFDNLYKGNEFHDHPLSYGYDDVYLALFVEFIDCPTVRGQKKKKLWTDENESGYQEYLAKIESLDIQDLNEGNIVVCDNKEVDPFYVIDLGYSRKLLRRNFQSLLRVSYWYEQELPKNREALNFLSYALLSIESK